jgi:hypothetical protein
MCRDQATTSTKRRLSWLTVTHRSPQKDASALPARRLEPPDQPRHFAEVVGIVLGGWSSGSTYSLLGGLRSSAQMISYEVAMGLALVAVFLYGESFTRAHAVAFLLIWSALALYSVDALQASRSIFSRSSTTH